MCTSTTSSLPAETWKQSGSTHARATSAVSSLENKDRPVRYSMCVWTNAQHIPNREDIEIETAVYVRSLVSFPWLIFFLVYFAFGIFCPFGLFSQLVCVPLFVFSTFGITQPNLRVACIARRLPVAYVTMFCDYKILLCVVVHERNVVVIYCKKVNKSRFQPHLTWCANNIYFRFRIGQGGCCHVVMPGGS